MWGCGCQQLEDIPAHLGWERAAAARGSASFLHANEEANELIFERVKEELEGDGLP